MEKLSGLIAAPFTAFHEDGSVAPELVPQQVESLLADGVSGAYICGTTGEGVSLTVGERIELMRAWSKASGGRLKLLAHIGAMALGDVKVLAQEAQKLNFFATSVIPTTFFRPASVEVLTDYCQTAASYAPELPFYYYHTMNSLVNLSMRDFLECAKDRIPNLAGVKFNHHNLYDYQNAINVDNGRFDVIFGVDEFFAGALALGAKGFIGSTYNYSAPLYTKIRQAFAQGDWSSVHRMMHQVCRGVDLLVANGGIPAGKAMMLLKGINCGPARSPLARLSPEKRQEIACAMQSILAEVR